MTANNVNKHKTYYIPYMCDHSHVMGAALESFGLSVETLPPPDDETLNIGLDSVLGKECSPCFTTTGDLLRLAQRPDFDPSNAIILMPSAHGPCRFGQYGVLQRQILDDHGLQAVEIISPSAENAYQGFGDDPIKVRMLLWSGLVVTDLLQKLLHAHRPYEVHPGQTDALYQECLQRIIADARAGGGRRFDQTVDWMTQGFETLPVERNEPRPIIGLVGEIYLRFNEYANQDIIRQVEAAGGEVLLATMQEWIYYINWDYVQRARDEGQFAAIFTTILSDLYQRYQEHRFAKRVAHLLKHSHETPSAKLMDHIRPYYEPILSTEAVMTMGGAIDLAKHGASGILNIMPFSCMPGIISAGLAPRIRADLDNIPWLDVTFDARGSTNFHTRLEAFMHQAIQYYRRIEL